MSRILVMIVGFSSGFLVAGGVVSVMVGLGILTRFIGISHTAAALNREAILGSEPRSAADRKGGGVSIAALNREAILGSEPRSAADRKGGGVSMKQILWYEDAIFLGGVAGTVVTVFDFEAVIGAWILAIAGAFIGVFIGGWIMALEEVVDIFPVYSRRLGITKGAKWLVFTLAVGKVVGNLIYFSRGLGA